MSDPHPHIHISVSERFLVLQMCVTNRSCSHRRSHFPTAPEPSGPYHRPGARESFTTCNDLTGAKFRRSFLVSKLSAKKIVGPLGKFAQRKHPDRVLKDAFVYLTGKNNCHREKMLGG